MGSMNLTVDHSQRSGDTISIGGNVGNIGTVGGSNVQSSTVFKDYRPKPSSRSEVSLKYLSEQSREKFGSKKITGDLPGENLAFPVIEL